MNFIFLLFAILCFVAAGLAWSGVIRISPPALVCFGIAFYLASGASIPS